MGTDLQLEEELRSIGREVVSAPKLESAVIHRIQRRRGASALLVTCMLLLLGTGAGVSINAWRHHSLSDSVAPAGQPTPRHSRLPYEGSYGSGLATRAGWRQAETNLTPRKDPFYQVVAAGTARLSEGGGTCPQFPVNAINRMGSRDAFFDLTRDPFKRGRVFPARPSDFKRAARQQVGPNLQLIHCISNPAIRNLYWLPFHEDGMFFHLLIAEGTRVSPKIERQLWSSVNGITISP